MADRKSDQSDDAMPAEEPKIQPETKPVVEIGERVGLDPTRYGNWEKGDRTIDF